MSLKSDFAQTIPITDLRDTGASQSLNLADTLPFSEKTSSGTNVLIQCVECGLVDVPLHNIYLSSDLVNGPVAVGIRQKVGKPSETDSIKFKISSKTSRWKKASTKRHHHIQVYLLKVFICY